MRMLRVNTLLRRSRANDQQRSLQLIEPARRHCTLTCRSRSTRTRMPGSTTTRKRRSQAGTCTRYTHHTVLMTHPHQCLQRSLLGQLSPSPQLLGQCSLLLDQCSRWLQRSSNPRLLGHTLFFFQSDIFGAKWIAVRALDTKLVPNCMKFRTESIGNAPGG